MEETKITGYKGFDKDFKCRDMQYEVGKSYEVENSKKIKCCPDDPSKEGGLHYCEHPLSVFGYYPPSMSRYAEVEAQGENVKGDDKSATRKLFIKAEISFKSLIEASVKFVFDRADWSKKENHATGYQGAASATGDYGAASATGNKGAASATGYQGAASATGNHGAASATGNKGAASATGYYGAASATGKDSTAIALGIEGKAKASLNNWIVLAEWKQNKDYTWTRLYVKTFQIDGETYKADTYYTLVNGQLKEAE